MQIREVFDRKRFVLLDGGMGTQLQTRGLQPGQKPELAALEMPDTLTAIHADYARAGADIDRGAWASELDGRREHLCGRIAARIVIAGIGIRRDADVFLHDIAAVAAGGNGVPIAALPRDRDARAVL